MNWQDNPRLKAAALAGVAPNKAYPITYRLTAAIQALDLLFEHLERLDADAVEAVEREQGDRAMSVAQQHLAELRRYREEHPDVDWDNNTYVCSLNPDLTLNVAGHRPMDDADRESFARLRECCVPDCPTHRRIARPYALFALSLPVAALITVVVWAVIR